jgi:transcriptional pleiotropic repressor
VVFSDICDILKEVLEADVLIINKKGKILGTNRNKVCNFYEFENLQTQDIIEEKTNDFLLKVKETESNLPSIDFMMNIKKEYQKKDDIYITIVPINGGGEKIGTLLVYRDNKKFNDEDLVLIEYGSTVVGMEILIAKQENLRVKQAESETEIRKKAIVQLAIGTLSYSELEAITHIFNELEGDEGLLVASKIADRAKITRSVIVNALRKFESAGLIEARSLGMKGTHIKILNNKLFEELEKIKNKN